MELTLVWTGLAVYVAMAIAIALLSRKGMQRELNDYFLARRSMGGVLSALSYGATTYSAFMLVGLAGLPWGLSWFTCPAWCWWCISAPDSGWRGKRSVM